MKWKIFALVFFFCSVAFLFLFRMQSNESKVAFANDRFKTVIIDPGHGGEDGGAVGEFGILEKDINLDVSKKLESLLNLFGINTEMIRRDDLSLGAGSSDKLRVRKVNDIKKRVEIINNIPNSVLISIHQNSFPQENCKGAQVFYSDKNSESKALADFVQQALRLGLDKENKRKTKLADSSIYILNNVKCPATLVECGFLTNVKEAELLKDESYQKKIALCITSALVKNSNERSENHEAKDNLCLQ